MVNDNRPRGILTESDRDLVELSHTERLEKHSPQNLIQRRNKIEERVRNGILDLPHLYRHFPLSEREEVFGGIVRHYSPWTRAVILRESFAFLLVGFLEQSNYDFGDEEIYESTFEQVINATLEAVSIGAEEVNVDVIISGWASTEKLAKSKDWSRYSRNQLRNMLNAGEITDEQYAEAILEKESSD